MLSESQLAFYREQGYVVVPSVLTPDECDEITRHSEDVVLDRAPRSPGTGVWMEPDAEEQGLVTPDSRFRYLFKIGHQMHMTPGVFQRYATHPNVVATLVDLLGPDVKCIQSMFIEKSPGIGVGQPYHQDSWYLKTEPDTLLAVWIACDDVDVENGTIHVVPGSQADPVHPHEKPRDPTQRIYVEVHSARERPEAACPLRKGDAVFFPGRTLHRSGNNRTADSTRHAYVLHYGSARSRWLNNPKAVHPFLLVHGRDHDGCL